MKEEFVVSIPEGIELAEAAPLLCACITTYSPLHHWHAGPGKKVAIDGIGGLEHLAVKFSHAMGADVTALRIPIRSAKTACDLGLIAMLTPAKKVYLTNWNVPLI